MTQSEGFISKYGRKVCKLHKSIYGLKQASRSMITQFDEIIKEFGFSQNSDEACVYKKVSMSVFVFSVLYVDDILLIGNDILILQFVKIWLSKNFSIKYLREVTNILGIKIYRDRYKRLFGLSQSTHINKMLKRFSMEQSKRGFIPIIHGIKLSKFMCHQTQDERTHMSLIPYASGIGLIMYFIICTRPDVSYALSITRRYQTDLGEGH